MDPLKEEKMLKGKYDMSDFFPYLKSGFEDAPEYKGPIEVVHVGNKGRGVIATEDIANEEIIMVSKAFVCGPKRASKYFLLNEVAIKVDQDPELRSEIYELHAGKKLGHEPQPNEPQPINKERVLKILQINLFSSDDSRGIWILPSFLNHNCIDINCRWVCHSNFLFVRATRPIKRGEELLIQYTIPTDTYCQRLKFFEAHEFICDCRLCDHQRKDLLKEERKTEILEMVESLSKKREIMEIEGDIEILKIYMEEFEEMGLACGKPEWNFSIRILLEKLFQLYEKLEVNEERIKAQRQIAYKYYNVLTKCPENEGGATITIWFGAGYYMARVCVKTQDWEGLKGWIAILKKDLRALFGDSDVFKDCYPELYGLAVKHGIQY